MTRLFDMDTNARTRMVEIQWCGTSYRLSTSWSCETIQTNAAYYCQAWIDIAPRQPEKSRHLAIGRFDLAGYISTCRSADRECPGVPGSDYNVAIGNDCVIYAVTRQGSNGFDLYDREA